MHLKIKGGEFPFPGNGGSGGYTEPTTEPTTRDKIEYLHKHLNLLNDWETGFVCNVINFSKRSEKQIAVVDKLFARVSKQQ
jgi:hypothetical protein